MSISTVRTDVAAAIAAALPDVDVIAWPRSADVPNARRVVLGTASVEPAGTACPWRTVKLDAWCVTPYTDPGPADDDLEALLADVLDALDAAGIAWTTADRGVWLDSYPAFRVTIERES